MRESRERVAAITDAASEIWYAIRTRCAGAGVDAA